MPTGFGGLKPIFYIAKNNEMMGKTYYYITSEVNTAGETEIYMRLYVNKEIRPRVQSGIWIDRNRWGKKNEINVPITPGEERERLLEKRAKLKALTEYLEKYIHSADDPSIITREYLEKLIRKFHKPPKAAKERPVAFFDIAEEYITKHKISEQRLKNFKVLIRALRRYELYKRKTGSSRFKLNLATVTPDHLREIEEFLKSEKEIFAQYPDIYEQIPYSTREASKTARKRKPLIDEQGNEKKKGEPKPRGENTVADMFNRLRAFFIWANDNDYTTNNPFKKFTIGEIVYGSPIYITVEERNQLYQADLSACGGIVEQQRDIFVFQSLIGCRVSDLYRMTRRNIIDGAIEYIARKTKEGRPVTVRVPLHPVALEIIDRYSDPHRETLLPFVAEQTYNEKIKEAFKHAELNRTVTVLNQQTREAEQRPLYEVASSHMARRTFVGNIYKKVKDPNLVGALSGHKEGSRAFARYRTIDDEMKKELISMLD